MHGFHNMGLEEVLRRVAMLSLSRDVSMIMVMMMKMMVMMMGTRMLMMIMNMTTTMIARSRRRDRGLKPITNDLFACDPSLHLSHASPTPASMRSPIRALQRTHIRLLAPHQVPRPLRSLRTRRGKRCGPRRIADAVDRAHELRRRRPLARVACETLQYDAAHAAALKRRAVAAAGARRVAGLPRVRPLAACARHDLLSLAEAKCGRIRDRLVRDDACSRGGCSRCDVNSTDGKFCCRRDPVSVGLRVCGQRLHSS